MKEKTSIEQEIDPAIKSNPLVAQVVEQAVKLLAEEAEGTSIPARVTWEADNAAAEPGVVVQLSDEFGSVSKRFTRSQLADTNWVRYEMIRLWGDMLAKRSKVMMDRLREMAAAEG